MHVSTRAPGAGGAASGMRLALNHAAWFAPLLAPLALLQSLLLMLPWLDSLEATSQHAAIAAASDWRGQQYLSSAASILGGIPGASAICLLAVAAWLVILRAGPLASTPPWSLHETSHRRHALRLAAGLAGALACLVLDAPADRLEIVMDSVTSLRPTLPASILLVLMAQLLPVLAFGAILGATLALARVAHLPRVRLGSLAVLAATALLASGLQAAAVPVLSGRFDSGVSLASALGSTETPRPALLLALARDRAWPVAMSDGIAGVRFSQEAAARAEALLARRAGWSFLARDAERFLVGERLLAMDPQGARERALRSSLLTGRASMSLALLRSLGSTAASPEARRLIDEVETSREFHLGPQGHLLLGQAHARAGDEQRAMAALARLRSGGERSIADRRVGVPIRLTRFSRGSVSGRILINDQPHANRVGLVATGDLFSLPDEGSDVAVTWLLRLVAAAPADADGRFRFEGLPEDEMALVVLLPEALAVTAPAAALPRIEVNADNPHVDLGEIRLRAAEAHSPG